MTSFRPQDRLQWRLVALAMVALVLLGAGTIDVAGAAPPPQFTTLRPGEAPQLTEAIPVQIVLIGYESDLVPEEEFRSYLSAGGKPVIRGKRDYGVKEEVGLEYTYDYEFVYADQAYEDAFFAHLASIAVPEVDVTGYDTSLYQFAYNLQATNVVDVADSVVIDPVEVERWLVEHPAPGIDPARNTMAHVNWWGRPDFRFHTYRLPPTDPDPDTGVDHAAKETRRIIGWGGTGPHDEETGFGLESRTWFVDHSAGPEWNTASWLLDDDLGTGLPPDTIIWGVIWEYLVPGGAGRPEWITSMLALITRYNAVNFLFAPSPLYAPYLNDHRLPADIELDITVHDGLGAGPFLKPEVLQQELGEVLGEAPAVEITYRPLAGHRRNCFDAWVVQQRCQPEANSVYPPDANLYLALKRDLGSWRDGSADYEAGGFVLASHSRPKYLGYADDDWKSGGQSAVFGLPTPTALSGGWGTTNVMAHEYGHHFGLSHVHDGYDPESDIGYGPFPNHRYVWLGSEVSTNMSYLDVNGDFSQFDIDNMSRWRSAAFLRSANAIAADVLASSGSKAALPTLTRADAAFTAAQAALSAHDYGAAADHARAGYWLVRQAADEAAVAVVSSDEAWDTLPPGKRVIADHDEVRPGADPIDQVLGTAELPPEIVAARQPASR